MLLDMKFNKLVRDRIPEIIRNKGEKPITRIADDEEYWQRLKDKLEEEVDEFLHDGEEKEEIADILEVLHAIMDFRKIKKADVEKLRQKKEKERGGFREKIILESKE